MVFLNSDIHQYRQYKSRKEREELQGKSCSLVVSEPRPKEVLRCQVDMGLSNSGFGAGEASWSSGGNLMNSVSHTPSHGLVAAQVST